MSKRTGTVAKLPSHRIMCTFYSRALRCKTIHTNNNCSVIMNRHAVHTDSNIKMYDSRHNDNDDKTFKGNANHITIDQMTSSS